MPGRFKKWYFSLAGRLVGLKPLKSRLAELESRAKSRHAAAESRFQSQLAKLDARLDSLQANVVENLVHNTFNLASRDVANASRSVLFLHQSYYHFFYLSRALRERGWNAQLVSFASPKSVWNKYYHGADAHFFTEGAGDALASAYGEAVLQYAKAHFEMVHFAGDGLFSFLPQNFGLDAGPDMLQWREEGKKIGYTISGCNSGVSPDTVAQWSLLGGRNVCGTCIWNDRPDVCSPERSERWRNAIVANCDLICGEIAPALDALTAPQAILEPLTTCVDPDRWSPLLVIPGHLERMRKSDHEVLVFHGMGEPEKRTDDRRNIKGTPAIRRAVEKLQKEGYDVRFVLKTGVRNTLMPYYQAQADIIVDQLNYGRYGAQAREGMMLGKPVICYLNRQEAQPNARNLALAECPLVSATEETVSEVLKELVLDKGMRERIGRDSRDYALKWHSPDRCAARYEKVYDALQTGRPVSEVNFA